MQARRAASTDLGEGALGEDAADGTVSSCFTVVLRVMGEGEDVHEQTGLSTGAVTDNNELSSNLGHGVVGNGLLRRRWGQQDL